MIDFDGLREALSLKTVPDELIRILKTAAAWSNKSGYNIRISSLNDHTHSNNSLHYSDLAVDFQVHSKTKNGTPNKRAMGTLAKHFKSHLGYGYDVIWNSPGHYNHIHVEYDQNERPRKNAD